MVYGVAKYPKTGYSIDIHTVYKTIKKSMDIPEPSHSLASIKKNKATSTVGRGKTVQLTEKLAFSAWNNSSVSLSLGNKLNGA